MRLSSELNTQKKARKLSSVSFQGSDYDVMDMTLSEIIKLSSTKPDLMTYQLKTQEIFVYLVYLEKTQKMEQEIR